MEKLRKMQEREFSPLIRVIFGLESPSEPSENPEALESKMEFFDPALNESQKDAVCFALGAREIASIHGPPGVCYSDPGESPLHKLNLLQTGKTYTLIELIRQLVRQKLRVLVCGPSNVSVDNIVERLAPHKLPIIRLGHPARLLPSVLGHSLGVLTQSSEAAAIVRDVQKEIDAKQASIKKTRNGKERRAIYGEVKELRKEYRSREKLCVTRLVGESKVVLATLHGAGGFQLRNETFDVLIIDEASQALEAQCWIPLLSAKKLILAGDHLQLPPTIKSSVNASKSAVETASDSDPLKTKVGVGTLETTLFDRLLALHGSSIKRMLTTQYRMHEKIMRFPSDEMYESKLIAANSVKGHLLTGLSYPVKETDDTISPLVFWDTQGGDFPEKSETDDGTKNTRASILSDSKSNEMEALLVKHHVRNLILAGVSAEDIAVVTPYNAQLALLAHDLKERFPGIELGSVDGFQGREKEAVILSLVRSNAEHEIGFLAEKRRLNGKALLSRCVFRFIWGSFKAFADRGCSVAMTRPKRHLCVIGDSETVSR